MQHALSSRFGGVVGEQGLDPGRIIASAGALAIHVVVLLLLLVPAKLPPLAPEAVRLPDIRIIPRRQPVPVVPVPVEVAPPTAIPDPKPVAATPAPPVEAPQPTVAPQPMDIPVAPALPVATTPAVEPASQPTTMTGATLRYAAASPPPYPVRALRAGAEGTVLLEVLVDTDGQPLEVTIARSSGHRELDRAALRHVLEHWRFQPAMRDGHAVRAIGLVPISFALRR
ncbi:TonB family protein [Lysobacter sp. F60174L2]|uniref:TonB family protein n=1 Tax=Lysobacter sp. F60174L2 TaxID=3459295 RepID=UPI00403D965E